MSTEDCHDTVSGDSGFLIFLCGSFSERDEEEEFGDDDASNCFFKLKIRFFCFRKSISHSCVWLH